MLQKDRAGYNLVEALLSEQQEWSAVEQFSDWHDRHQESIVRESFRRLIPLTRPGPSQQYAFEVDLDRCSGCKACVAACHSLNGLEETETWRKVGLLVGAPAVQQHVTTACHHCVDPGCLNGCPVLAYDKDPLTGIVRHLDDQCIGCQYCVMKCPYEVPQYSQRLGIVRKCDMCHDRLAVGEAPACVQACPTEAIRISVVDQSSLLSGYRPAPAAGSLPCEERSAMMFLPDSPNPALTVPATRFCSDNPALSTLRAADRFALKLEPAHWPLIMMLLLTQAASGLTLTACFGASSGRGSLSILVIAGILLAAGLLAASLHLGQPLKAWRAFLGWRTSWLSRELIALHIFAVAIALALCCPKTAGARQLFIAAAAVCGLTAVFTSAMVYIDTGRAAWAPRITLINFFGTTVVLGAGGAAIQRGIAAPMVFLACALAARAFLFVWRDFSELRALNSFQDPLHRRALITQDFLRRNKQLEAASFLAQAFSCLVAFGAEEHSRGLLLGIGALAAFGGELACRYEFFVASAGKRMPGGVVT